MRTLIHTGSYRKDALELMGDTNMADLEASVANAPFSAGALITETGGIRKIRGNRDGVGKSGGVRVFYYPCHSNHTIIYMVACIPKSEDKRLSGDEKKALRELASKFEAEQVA